MKKRIKPKVGDIIKMTRSIFTYNIGKIGKVIKVFPDDIRVDVWFIEDVMAYDRFNDKLLWKRKFASINPVQAKLLHR